MERECTPNCVGYIASDDLKESLSVIIDTEMPCMRLLMEISSTFSQMAPPSFFDEDDDEEDLDDIEGLW